MLSRVTINLLLLVVLQFDPTRSPRHFMNEKYVFTCLLVSKETLREQILNFLFPKMLYQLVEFYRDRPSF